MKVQKCIIDAGAMKLTSISKSGQIWTFSPNDISLYPIPPGGKKIYMIVYIDNMTKGDIDKAKKASILFFKYKMPQSSASCLVDRFDRYPLD